MRPVGELGLGVSAAREPETYLHKTELSESQLRASSI